MAAAIPKSYVARRLRGSDWLGPGSTIFIPAGTPHRLCVQRAPARVLEIDTDGGLDEYYRELARELPPGKEVDGGAIAAIQQRHATRQVAAADAADGVD